MSNVQERYSPIVMAANATATTTRDSIGGFLAKTSGTITVVAKHFRGTATVTLVDAHPVTAGVYTPLPFYVGPDGATVTLAGGASGTLAV